jgi:serine/threonine protein phosphatase PrpC
MSHRFGLVVIDSATSKGEGDFNEDLGGATPRRAWVLDGATDVSATIRPDPAISGARWIVERIDQLFRGSHDDLSPGEIFDAIALSLRDELDTDTPVAETVPPACSAGIVTAGSSISAAIVGDIYIYNLAHRDLLATNAFDRNEKRAAARATMRRSSAAETDAGIASRRLDYLNGRHGQWILGNNPGVSQGVMAREWRANDGDLMLLCTDGFARAVSSYGIFDDWEQISRRALATSVGAVVSMIRRHEHDRADPSEHFKGSDDIFAMIVRCTVEEDLASAEH